jgi:hypothetical protein
LEALEAGGGQVTLRFGAPVEPERFFAAVAGSSRGVAGHLAGFLVARLLPEEQRGLYGEAPRSYLDHPHFRQRISPNTLADIEVAGQLAGGL